MKEGIDNSEPVTPKTRQEGDTRRTHLRHLLLTMGALVFPSSPVLPGSERQHQLEKTLEAVSQMPASRQLQWYEEVLRLSGELRPFIRTGDFSDRALDRLFLILANISNALNGAGDTDPGMRTYRERLPAISDVPHMYTLTTKAADGSLRDFGNVQATSHAGKLYLQSSRHVIDAFRAAYPDFADSFLIPKRLNRADPLPDVAIARLSRVPITDESDMRVVEVPNLKDSDVQALGGQVNVIIGYKSDGGILRHAGVVLPTPKPMLARLREYFHLPPATSIDVLETFATMEQGGLMLMPGFFGEVVEGGGMRAAGRSGSARFINSPRHKASIPGGNFMAMITAKTVHGLSLGFVDSATHAIRAYTEAEEKSQTSAPMRVLNPRPVAGMKGYFEISPGVYLRDFQRSIGEFETQTIPAKH